MKIWSYTIQMMEMKAMVNGKIYLLMILATFFWSGSFITGKISAPYIPPFTLTFMRFLIATVILYIVLKRRYKEVYKLTRQDIPVFLFTGIVGMCGHHVLFFKALRYSSAVNLSLINAANPIMTAILSIIFLREKLTPYKTIGILLSFTGVLLTLTEGKILLLKNLAFNTGDLIMVAAVFVWSCYYVFSKKVIHRYSPMTIAFYSFLFCTLALVPLLFFEMPWRLIDQIPYYSYLGALYMGIFPTVIGFVIQQMAIKEIGPSKTSIFSNLVLVFSMVLSALLLGEAITLVNIFTALLIIAGVYICQIQHDTGKTGQKLTITPGHA